MTKTNLLKYKWGSKRNENTAAVHKWIEEKWVWEGAGGGGVGKDKSTPDQS